jgi:hypothetical protein
MEILVFAIGAFVLSIYWIWRVRRGGSRGKQRFVEGLPNDLRDKNTGLGSLPNRGRPWGRGN